MGIFDIGQFEDREMQIRDYMKEDGVTLQELSAECHVSRTTAVRQLKAICCIGDMVKIIDRIAERKEESRCNSWKECEEVPQ